jgi:hypothetical protein
LLLDTAIEPLTGVRVTARERPPPVFNPAAPTLAVFVFAVFDAAPADTLALCATALWTAALCAAVFVDAAPLPELVCALPRPAYPTNKVAATKQIRLPAFQFNLRAIYRASPRLFILFPASVSFVGPYSSRPAF